MRSANTGTLKQEMKLEKSKMSIVEPDEREEGERKEDYVFESEVPCILERVPGKFGVSYWVRT